MKKIIILLFAALLCLAPGALAASPAVVDMADLFTYAEETSLTAMIDEFRHTTGMDFAIITSYEEHDESIQDIADALYEQGGYGLRDEYSGILYLIDMYERTPYLCTTGEMIDYMTDERIEEAHNLCWDDLAAGAYSDAAETMIAAVTAYYQRGIPEGQYQYDAITGRMLTARHKALTSGEIGVCAIVAAVIGFLFVKSVQGGYSLKGSTYRYDLRENSSVTLTESVDDYLRTTTTRTRKADPPSGGSGSGSHSGGSRVHTSSGGMRHGGGAGKRF